MRPPKRNPFEKIDANGDGSLDKTELQSFADKISERSGKSINVSKMLSEADSDSNGLLSEKEFKTTRPPRPPGPPPMRMKNDEESNILNTNKSETSESSFIEQLMNELDTNDDNLVSKDELDTFFQQYVSNAYSSSSQYSQNISSAFDTLV